MSSSSFRALNKMYSIAIQLPVHLFNANTFLNLTVQEEKCISLLNLVTSYENQP